MEQIKLLSVSAVLTVLIWAGADSLVNETVTVRAAFEVAPLANTDMLVAVDPAVTSQLFEIQLAGPRRVVENIQILDEPLLIRIRIGDRPGGSSLITLDKDTVKRAMIEKWREIGKLSLLSVQPPALPVVVDHMISRQVDIVAKRLTLAYESAPQFKRNIATVRMRESRQQELTSSGQAADIDVSADLERLLRRRSPGIRTTVQLTLDSSSFGPNAVLTPDSIEVTATLKPDRNTVEIPTVPIKPAVSFANLSKSIHAVARDGTSLGLVTQTIKVTGPAENVAALLRGDTRAYGFIQFKEEDLADVGVYKAWTPDFILPPNIELAAPPVPIECKLVNVNNTDSS